MQIRKMNLMESSLNDLTERVINLEKRQRDLEENKVLKTQCAELKEKIKDTELVKKQENEVIEMKYFEWKKERGRKN
ncbi:hypothetical protein E2C01_038724 [Portunus trituberculatus]|uniref:Uncharacterized protein n=1 Tax=Portunus trituberculatus TaxID=210409 RepID=A0A5B7FCY7_PORTR|nr:hypothetical protein [Portunus trituberculatus]